MISFSGISILICTHNGAKRLLPTLEALTLLKANFPWEIIIINNASNDETDQVVRDFFDIQEKQFNWKIIEEAKPGLIHARLKGIASASFDYVLFCDDDNWLFPDYLTNAAEILSETPDIGALGGKGIAAFEREKPIWFDQYCSSFGIGPQDWHLNETGQSLGYLYGAGAIFKKSILVTIINSGFQPVLTGRKGNSLVSGDDVELCYLVQLLGFKLCYSNSLQFYHWMEDTRMDWNYYINLKKGIAKGTALLYSYEYYFKHPSSDSVMYSFDLIRKLIKSDLIYRKNQFFNSKHKRNKTLSLMILRTIKDSYKKDFFRSISHFINLKKHFEA
jgi:glycosyltransferase involved in cell wall biosynthesis